MWSLYGAGGDQGRGLMGEVGMGGVRAGRNGVMREEMKEVGNGTPGHGDLIG